MNGYIDLFALPVSKKNLRTYRNFSTRFGKIMKAYGALEYREFAGDDLNVKGVVPFPSKIKIKAGEILVTSVIGYRSKAHRNQVNKIVQKDPRTKRMSEEMMKKPIMDMKRMLYGGFSTIVKV